MKQVQVLSQSLIAQLWQYLVKPFQITKVLELLYALNWIWFALLSLLPGEYVTGTLFTLLQHIMSKEAISLLVIFIASASTYAMWHNNILLRKMMLLFNIGVELFLFSKVIITIPVPATSGYLFILAALTMFAYWRMDTTY